MTKTPRPRASVQGPSLPEGGVRGRAFPEMGIVLDCQLSIRRGHRWSVARCYRNRGGTRDVRAERWRRVRG
jgi:hypothetical protein